jgi:transposase
MAQTHYHSGTDLHQRTSVICTLDDSANVVREAALKNHPALFAAYFASMPGSHRAVVEATSGLYWLHDLCAGLGVEIKLAHAWALKAISSAKVKTDRVDAAMLAQLLRADLIPEAFAMPPKPRELRDLLRGRLRLIASRTRCKNTIKSILEQYNTDRDTGLPDLYQVQVAAQHEQIGLLDRQIASFEKRLRPQLHRDLTLYRLACVPGMGEIVASTILLETGGHRPLFERSPVLLLRSRGTRCGEFRRATAPSFRSPRRQPLPETRP